MKRESVTSGEKLFAKYSSMSRIGKKSVPLPSGVTMTFKDHVVTITGPKGELTRAVDEKIVVSLREESGASFIDVTMEDTSNGTAVWGTARAHILNMVRGVTTGWKKILELNGVGYKMQIAGETLKMQLGFSHESLYTLPKGIKGTIEANALTLEGIDRDLVGKVASEIRAMKKPEPYKGKGFKYNDEVIKRKVGKAAKGE